DVRSPEQAIEQGREIVVTLDAALLNLGASDHSGLEIAGELAGMIERGRCVHLSTMNIVDCALCVQKLGWDAESIAALFYRAGISIARRRGGRSFPAESRELPARESAAIL